MLRTFALAATFGLIASPTLAQTACHRPYVPDISSNTAPTKQDVIAMRDDAKSFLDASDLYQACLGKIAVGGPVFAAQVSVLMDQSQRDKKLVGDRVNAAILAFNAAQHSGVKVSDASH